MLLAFGSLWSCVQALYLIEGTGDTALVVGKCRSGLVLPRGDPLFHPVYGKVKAQP
jgi:hypothetical protein